jgi:alpha-beta hydrolase superfamily lysophospholipase
MTARRRAHPLDWLRRLRRSARRFSCAVRFHADRYVAPPPAGVVERWITTRDGVRLHAWYAPAAGARATVIWSHGNGLSIARRPQLVCALAARGVNVLAYDYRGSGRSAGRPRSERGLYLDSLAAYDSEVACGVSPARIVALGESLGGAVAIFLASQRRVAGLVVVSTATRLRDVHRGFGPLALLMRFDSLGRIPRVAVPVFIAHGDRDRTVRFEHGERLFAAAREPKRFFRAAGAGHDDVLESPGLLDAIAAFTHDATAQQGERHATH